MAKSYKSTESRLTKIASDIGKKYGYTSVEVSVDPSISNLDVKWQRGYNWYVFLVPTSFVRIPEEVAKDIFRYMFKQSKGKNVQFSQNVLDWVEKVKTKKRR